MITWPYNQCYRLLYLLFYLNSKPVWLLRIITADAFSLGEVFLIKKLDRDRQPSWDVNVLANDEPYTPTNRIGYAIISVFPDDINDNAPEFNTASLSGSVDENLNPGEANKFCLALY